MALNRFSSRTWSRYSRSCSRCFAPQRSPFSLLEKEEGVGKERARSCCCKHTIATDKPRRRESGNTTLISCRCVDFTIHTNIRTHPKHLFSAWSLFSRLPIAGPFFSLLGFSLPQQHSLIHRFLVFFFLSHNQASISTHILSFAHTNTHEGLIFFLY